MIRVCSISVSAAAPDAKYGAPQHERSAVNGFGEQIERIGSAASSGRFRSIRSRNPLTVRLSEHSNSFETHPNDTFGVAGRKLGNEGNWVIFQFPDFPISLQLRRGYYV